MTRHARWLPPVLVALCLAPPAVAQDPTPTFASPNVELVRNLPLRHPPDGARLVGRHFYVTSRTDLSIYDVADPEDPVLLSRIDTPTNSMVPDAGWPTGYQEDVDTNGRILVRAPIWSDLYVVDVSDPRAPRLIGEPITWGGHTLSCVLDCRYVWSTSGGGMLDLTDPRHPAPIEGKWGPEDLDYINVHDLTEVAPGVVLAASDPMLLLDAREDPTRPKVLASTDVGEFVHGTHWPNQMQDRFVLAGGEAQYPDCTATEGPALKTFDTTGWREAGAFSLVDAYRVPSGGTFTDGRNVTATYCGHWADPHPRFRNGGLVTMAWYEHGTRFVRVRPDGRMEEAGWFLPLDSYAWSAHWISDRVVYSIDQYRGIDVLRFTGEIPAAPHTPAPPAEAAPRRAFGDLVTLPSLRRCVPRRGLSLRVRDASTVRRLTARIGGRRALTATGAAVRRRLRVRGIPRRRFTLTVQLTTDTGARLSGRATYRPCGTRGRRR